MIKHVIKLPEVIEKEFTCRLKKVPVSIVGIGDFSITRYTKKVHIQRKKNGGYERKKMKKIVLITFKAHPSLKESINKIK